VEALAREQQRRGLDVVIAAPAAESSRYIVDDLPVSRFPVSSLSTRSTDLQVLYGGGDDLARRGFREVLDEQRPDILHLHAFTPAVSAAIARDARLRGTPVVFTYHTPTVSCQRGTLLRWGDAICDGLLDTHVGAAGTLRGL